MAIPRAEHVLSNRKSCSLQPSHYQGSPPHNLGTRQGVFDPRMSSTSPAVPGLAPAPSNCKSKSNAFMILIVLLGLVSQQGSQDGR